jgi:hypothetical protein
MNCNCGDRIEVFQGEAYCPSCLVFGLADPDDAPASVSGGRRAGGQAGGSGRTCRARRRGPGLGPASEGAGRADGEGCAG